jgi:hypothetical protein
LKKSGLIDYRLQKQIAKAGKMWAEILSACHCHNSDCCSKEFSLRGHREILVGDYNPGNFLALLKHLAKFDPVMRKHFGSVSGKPGCLSYFSPDIQNKLINLLEARVLQTTTSSIQKTKHYNIMLGTILGSEHMDQMSQMADLLRFSSILWKSRKLLST